MPNIEPEAKAWELALATRIGVAVQVRRRALRLTAQQLAQRTAELGYPITRVAISKIETCKRAGKMDIAEVIVLAKALEMPPILLLYPGFPEGYEAIVDETYGPPGEPFRVSFSAEVETLPGQVEISREAALWFTGHLPSMWIPGDKQLDEVEQSVGANLVQDDALAAEQIDQLEGLRHELGHISAAATPEAIERLQDQVKYTEHLLARTRQALEANQDELWGTWQERQDRARRHLRSRGVGVNEPGATDHA